MNYIKTIKFVLFLGSAYFLFPKLNNGLFTAILKLIFYMLLLFLSHAVINDLINYISLNWHKLYLRWIDEREHIKGNTLANITRLDWVGIIFRTIHYARTNKKRFMIEMWYNFLENIAIYLTIIFVLLFIIGVIIFKIYFF